MRNRGEQARRILRSSSWVIMLIAAVTEVVAQEPPGAGLYRAACTACHGADGKGPPEGRKLTVPTPDLTDCSFATREPDADWMAVIHQGGPVRKFDETMPAFGESLSTDQIQQILDHVRGFCQDGRWPRGELNLPRSFFTEKAYPEDEAVSTLSIDDAQRRVVNELVYERRFGASTQFELKLPFGGQEQSPANAWRGGLGDLVVGVKQVVHHNLDWGTILSVGAELQAPTGSASTGMGVDSWIAEPFIAFGKALPRDAFVQLLAEAELPSNESQAEREAGLRAVVGRTFTAGTWGRTWTPMLEVLVGRELESGAELEWDLVPQLQVSLSTRQHVLGNVGVRFPVTETGRPTQFLFYILWDWFDGGFFDGW